MNYNSFNYNYIRKLAITGKHCTVLKNSLIASLNEQRVFDLWTIGFLMDFKIDLFDALSKKKTL